MFWSSNTTLIVSKEEMNDIMRILKKFEESGLLLKGASKTNKNEGKEQKGGFPNMLLGTLGASLLENLWTGQEAVETSRGRSTTRAGEGTVGAGQDF